MACVGVWRVMYRHVSAHDCHICRYKTVDRADMPAPGIRAPAGVCLERIALCLEGTLIEPRRCGTLTPEGRDVLEDR